MATHYGTYDGRPKGLNANQDIGFKYFDITLGKPVWWNGNNWVDATSKDVDLVVMYNLTNITASNQTDPNKGEPYTTFLYLVGGYYSKTFGVISLKGVGTRAYFWSSTPTYSCYFEKNIKAITESSRFTGMSIRPVIEI